MGLADSALRKKVDDLAGPYVRSKRNVGLAVGLLAGDESLVLGYGKVARDDRRTPDGHTVFEIGSVTKVFTAALLAEMAGRGEVALDQPVAELLPPGVRMPVAAVSRSRWPTLPSTPRPCRGCRATCGPP